MNLYFCGNQWGYTPRGNSVNIPTDHCDAPLNLKVTVKNNVAYLSWDAPHDYAYFKVEAFVLASPGMVTGEDVYGTSIAFTLNGLTVYGWRVLTVCDAETMRSSVQATGPNFATGEALSTCVAVSTVTITSMATFYRASWVDTGAQYYQVYLSIKGSRSAVVFTTQQAFYDFTDLVEGTSYDVYVYAVCRSGMAAVSPTVSFVVGKLNCPKPGAINFTRNATSILLSWGTAGIGYTYNIYLNDVLIAEKYPNTFFTVSQLTSDTDYQISIITNCTSGFSESIDATIRTSKLLCEDPSDVVAVATNDGFDLSWTPVPGILSQLLVINNGTPIPLLAADSTYNFNSGTSGNTYSIILYSVCSLGNQSPGVQRSVVMNGCSSITGLIFIPGSDRITAKWKGPGNALAYRVLVTKSVGGDVVFDSDILSSEITLGNLLNLTQYIFSITAKCDSGDATPVVGNSTTLAKATCELAVIDSITTTQTTATVTFHFASGRTTGNIKVRFLRQSDHVLIFSGTYSQVLAVTATPLVPGTAYEVQVYHDDGNCAPANVTIHNQPAACAKPVINTLTMNSTNTNITVGATVAGGGATHQVEYQLEGSGIWTVASANATFPYVITPLTPGLYKVRIISTCTGPVKSDYSDEKYACPKPLNVLVIVRSNILELSWDPIAGLSQYTVELVSLMLGDRQYTAISNHIIIPDLPANTSFIGYVKAKCPNDAVISSDQFKFATGSLSEEGGGDSLCQPPDYAVYVQDCKTTDPIGGDDSIGSGSSACSVVGEDWEYVSHIFAPVNNDPPNDTFIEATFQIAVLPSFAVQLFSAGILGRVVEAACWPASTTALDIEIVVGGSIITASASLDDQGNLTITGSYQGDGSSDHLIVRVRGNYNQV